MESSTARKNSRRKLKIKSIICANCNIRVLPNPDGTCPSCQAIIPQSGDAAVIPPGGPVINRVAIEEFTYQKSWKVITYIRTAVLWIFALVMFGVGFFFVFPSGGQIVFGGMGWLYFIMAPIGAIAGILQYMNAANFSVKLSETEIRVGNDRAGWEEIVKMESHMTVNDMAYGDKTAIQLTTRQGNNLILPAATENLPYIKKYIEDHANIIIESDHSIG